MINHGFPRILQDAVWHTTSHEHFEQIIKAGQIEAEPDIPNESRWKTRLGPDTYPYVRTLGGVSLFEFSSFKPDSYDKEYVMSSWRSFVPFCVKWGASVWVEIDIPTLGQNYIPGRELLARWKRDKAFKHTIMPIIEAASLAPISLGSFKRVLESSSADPTLRERPL